MLHDLGASNFCTARLILVLRVMPLQSWRVRTQTSNRSFDETGRRGARSRSSYRLKRGKAKQCHIPSVWLSLADGAATGRVASMSVICWKSVGVCSVCGLALNWRNWNRILHLWVTTVSYVIPCKERILQHSSPSLQTGTSHATGPCGGSATCTGGGLLSATADGCSAGAAGCDIAALPLPKTATPLPESAGTLCGSRHSGLPSGAAALEARSTTCLLSRPLLQL